MVVDLDLERTGEKKIGTGCWALNDEMGRRGRGLVLAKRQSSGMNC